MFSLDLRDDVQLTTPPDDGVQLAFGESPAVERPGGTAQTHVDDQGPERGRRIGPVRHTPSPRPGRSIPRRIEFHRTEAKAVEHSPETDVLHGRRHAGETGLDRPVSDHGAGDVGSVASCIDPEILGLFRGRGKEGRPGEVGTADALPVRRDVQVVDVEPGVHDSDGDGSAAHPGEDPRSAVVRSQGVRPHGGNGRVVRRPDDADRLHGQYVIGRGDGFHLTVGNVGRVGPQIRIPPAHHGALVLQRSPPPAVGIVRHQGDEDGRLILRGRFRQLAGERLRKFPLRGGRHPARRLPAGPRSRAAGPGHRAVGRGQGCPRNREPSRRTRRGIPSRRSAWRRQRAGPSRRTSRVRRRSPGRRESRWTCLRPSSPDRDSAARRRYRRRLRFAPEASPRGRRRRNIRRAARESCLPRIYRRRAVFQPSGAPPESQVPGRFPRFRLRSGPWRHGSPWPLPSAPAPALRQASCSRRSAPSGQRPRPTTSGQGWFAYLLSA